MNAAPAGAAPAPSELRARLRVCLAGTAPSGAAGAMLAGLPPELSARYQHLLPADPAWAAVLVPIIDHAAGLTVLLTERAPELRHHAGQISFPGGRVEAGDDGPVAAALREAQEEIGLEPRHVEVLGFLPDQLIATGFRVTPVVALVATDLALRVDATEVAAVFEVPLAFVLDAANHRFRRRPIGDGQIDVYDIPYGNRNIWGATAGMLVALYRQLAGAAGAGAVQ